MSATMTEPTASKSLARELWISLASLLRSHVAMHSVAQPGGVLRIVSSSDSMIEVLGSNGKLTILGPGEAGSGESGTGSTEFRPEAGELGDRYATFFFTEKGLLQLDNSDTAMDIEAIVEHWLRKVQA